MVGKSGALKVIYSLSPNNSSVILTLHLNITLFNNPMKTLKSTFIILCSFICYHCSWMNEFHIHWLNF